MQVCPIPAGLLLNPPFRTVARTLQHLAMTICHNVKQSRWRKSKSSQRQVGLYEIVCTQLDGRKWIWQLQMHTSANFLLVIHIVECIYCSLSLHHARLQSPTAAYRLVDQMRRSGLASSLGYRRRHDATGNSKRVADDKNCSWYLIVCVRIVYVAFDTRRIQRLSLPGERCSARSKRPPTTARIRRSMT